MLSHKSEHSHVCPTCKRTFTRNSSLQLHMKNAHSNPTTDVTTESHKEPVGTVTTTTHTTSTSSGTTSVSYIQSPNTEKMAPVQVVTQSVGSTETTIVTQSSGTFIDNESFDAFQEGLLRTLTDDY
ncbi:C2H2-type zinc finger protein [Endozoicomonas gorgoniicola]|uniref:C2H2-type zinc finger protein n=2 Tax=Endozoicomonas gorgoniicola TaxID=1234144 RepID=A0ABT3MQR1_9GAMM|nr:C2H2-type zinc finger protein [Endozoicomonas gorgoniicola]